MVVFKYSDALDVVVYTEDDNKYCLSIDFHSNGYADLELGYTIRDIIDALDVVDMVLPEFIRRDILRAVRGDLG